MSRYIDADAVVERLDGIQPFAGNKAANAAINLAKDIVRNAPTVSPDEARGKGTWIVKQTAIGKDYTICSACKTDFKFKTDKGTLARLDMRGMPYCPHCGAKMEVE